MTRSTDAGCTLAQMHRFSQSSAAVVVTTRWSNTGCRCTLMVCTNSDGGSAIEITSAAPWREGNRIDVIGTGEAAIDRRAVCVHRRGTSPSTLRCSRVPNSAAIVQSTDKCRSGRTAGQFGWQEPCRRADCQLGENSLLPLSLLLAWSRRTLFRAHTMLERTAHTSDT